MHQIDSAIVACRTCADACDRKAAGAALAWALGHSAYMPDAGGARVPSHATSARMPITQAVSTARLARSAVSAPPWSFMAIERSKAGVRRKRLSEASPSIAANKTSLASSSRP